MRSGRKTWQEAKSFCEKRNSILATLQSKGEIVESGLSRLQRPFWIGGSDIEVEDVWTWLDGTPWPLRLKPFVSKFYSFVFVFVFVGLSIE